jgi:GNAT superfamily N-acetyltransferase
MADEFNRQVEALWAAHFGSSAEKFGRAGTTLLTRERLRGEGVIHIVYIRQRAVVEIDPVLEPEVRGGLAAAGAHGVLSSAMLARLWGAPRLAHVDAGLIFHLQPGALVRPKLRSQFISRPLAPTDQSLLDGLRNHCTPNEVDEGYVEIDHEIAWGCCEGERLVAVGSAYRRNGFMDLGVLTAPEFRGRGLARHIVCALSDVTLKLGLIPQYRCNRINRPSRRVAEGAGFTLYYTTESVRLSQA